MLELRKEAFCKVGKVARIKPKDTPVKRQEWKNIFIMNKESCFFQASKTLDILLNGSAHDVFAADVFYQ